MDLFDVWRVRERFPMLKRKMNGRPLVYLDTAATSQKPQCVIDAMILFYAQEYGTVHRAVYELAARSTEMYSGVRVKVQEFINARQEEEIVFTRGTTEAINLVAQSFGKAFLKAGDEIIISEMEHHSNIVPWQLLAEEKDLKLKFIPMDHNGELRLDVFQELLSERTKLVSVAHIANVTGTINPIKEITDLAHMAGAKVLIDGAQAASHLSLDMQKLDVDFYTFSGHKMYGPTGVGVLYGKYDLLKEMPPLMGGGDMIETVTMEKTTYQEPPLRFEAGTPSIAQVIGLGAAIEYIESVGKEQIEEWENRLLRYATEKLEEIHGLTIIGNAKKKSGIISFTLEDVHSLDLGTLLGLKGIAIRTGHLCAQPTLARFGLSSLSRISFGVYNTFEEVDTVVEAIQEGILLLKPELSY
ncbi:cysteine desulfurase [Candidatus Neptunochlamydia vexilliferae]|uniref:Cysteine desulfurase n=1 Tax=Candidatus Neptunichlamydia vexilliferae TaxID=1651774 RepID=A0ABS0B0B6_9BACT|nr:cysteine desulfurase [Candidatus Neptunochlamydia vexilliferae]MBF5059838.1 Cysteine desulfurase [Candidatus Neptunochlamydia vexilliferae]